MKFPFTHWVLSAPGARAKTANSESERDALIRKFTVEQGKPVHVIEYCTDDPKARARHVRTWTVEAKGK